MNVRFLAMLLAISLLLGGCGWFRGSYVNVTPYHHQSGTGQTGAISAWNYYQLRKALETLVSSGIESSVIDIANYEAAVVEANLNQAVEYIRSEYAVGAYAVEDIHCEVGTSSGKPAIAVSITYRRSRTELYRIQKVPDLETAEWAIGNALKDFDTVLVMEIQKYREADFVQMVETYAATYPEFVMEVPQVAAGVFGTGSSRVVELTFSYQTSRDSLRQMKNQVKPMFDAAALYVSGAANERQRYSQLYSFLMERFDYTLETSLTPTYSLLHHGVGDSRAFALVYASMCRRAGLDCRIVTGTRNGEPWTWNLVQDGERYYHVDLLRSNEMGEFREFLDEDMGGYVWDYSAYPECSAPDMPPETTPPAPAQTAPTQPLPPETAPTEPEKVPEDPPRETEETQPEEPEETTAATEENFLE